MELIGYVDDTDVMVEWKSILEVKNKAKLALQTIIKQINSIGLILASARTDMVVLEGRRKMKEVEAEIEGVSLIFARN